jgi:hypothetical protein
MHEDLGLVQQSIVTLQNQLDSLAASVLQNRRGLDLITAEKGGICMFLGEECCFYANQSGTVREKCTPITRENQGKGKKQGNILEYRMEELGPMGSPAGRPTYCAPYAITLRALCDKTHQVHSQSQSHEHCYITISETLSKTAPDDSPKMVIRDYEE